MHGIKRRPSLLGLFFLSFVYLIQHNNLYKIYNIIVPLSSSVIRIDKFLQSQLNKFSRTRLQNLIQEGFIKLNNKTSINKFVQHIEISHLII